MSRPLSTQLTMIQLQIHIGMFVW